MILRWPVATLKFLVFLNMMLLFLIHHAAICLLVPDEKRRTKYLIKSIQRYSVLGLKILNVRVECSNVIGNISGSLIVSNHLSYLDVLIFASRYPSLFITSVEIKETFLLGWVTQLAGCFFVERRKNKILPGTKAKELSLMQSKLSAGLNVFLFPEGTSSDGSSVLPFKATFFQLAVDGKIPVVPLCLKYIGEAKMTVPWYGTMTFPDHLLGLCLMRNIHAEIRENEYIYGDDKFALAQLARESIYESYR